MQAQNQKNWGFDAGVLILRSAGVFLALTFGRQEAWDFADFIRSGQPWNSWGFGQFVQSLGFPIPTFLAVCAVLSETIEALVVAIGFQTRLAAAFVASTMAVAFYVNMKLGEEPLRALLYVLMFE